MQKSKNAINVGMSTHTQYIYKIKKEEEKNDLEIKKE